MILLWLLTLVLGICQPILGNETTNYPTILPLANPYGVVPMEEGKITFSSSEWWVLFELNITHIPQRLDQLREILEGQPKISKAEATAINRIHQMLGKVEEEFNTLREAMSQPNQMRTKPTKRDISDTFLQKANLPAVGNGLFLHSVLGIATESEIQQTDAYLNTLFRRQEKLVTVQKLQLTALNMATDSVDRQRHQIDLLVNVTQTLYKLLKGRESNPMDTSALHMLRHSQCMATANALLTAVMDLKNIVHTLQAGQLTPDVLPRTQLLTVLQHLITELPADLHLIYPPEVTHLYPYYTLPLAFHIPSPHSIQGALRIPLTQSLFTLKLIALIPFPSHHPKPLSIQSTNRIILAAETTYVAYSEKSQEIHELGTRFSLDQCLGRDPAICPLLSTNPFSQGTTCHTHVLKNDVERVLSECTIRQFQSDAILALHLGGDDWAISTGSRVQGRVRCMDDSHRLQVQPDLTIEGTHRLQVPRNCTIQVRDITIPLRLREQIGLRQQQMFPIPTLVDEKLFEVHQQVWNKSKEAKEVEAVLHLLESLKKENYRNISDQLKPILQTTLREMDKIGKMHPVVYWNYANWALWSIMVVFVIGCSGSIYCHLKRKLRDTTQYQVSYCRNITLPPEA